MWTGPLWDQTIAGRLTEERAVALCFPTDELLAQHRASGLVWSDEDTEYAKRELRRSVRYIADAADLMAREHTLYHMDDLPNMAGTGRAPKMEALFEAIEKAGYSAARVPDVDPFLVTDAPHDAVIQCVRNRC